MNVLVTGGAGYIGSHTCVELLNAGYGVVVIDNLCNSNAASLDRVQKLTGKSLKFYEGDVRDEALLRNRDTVLRMNSTLPFELSPARGFLDFRQQEQHKLLFKATGSGGDFTITLTRVN